MFMGENAEQPVINELIRSYHVSVNILQGKVSKTRDGSYGTLFVQLEGSDDSVKEAIQYLKGQQVEAEVLEDDK